MADSVREAAMKALLAALETVTGPTVLRDEPQPEEIPADGLIVMREQDPGEPDEMMSPPRDAWIHPVNVEIYVRDAANVTRAEALDAIGQGIAAGLNADRTLGGKVTHLDFGPPVRNDDAVDGAAAIGAWVLSVYLHYETDAGGLAS